MPGSDLASSFLNGRAGRESRVWSDNPTDAVQENGGSGDEGKAAGYSPGRRLCYERNPWHWNAPHRQAPLSRTQNCPSSKIDPFCAAKSGPEAGMNAKEKAALGSIAASAGLTAAKGIIGALTGSLAILSEAGHSLIDFSATLLTYFAVRISGKPADAEHQYGHGKIESVTALVETALLFLLTAIVVFEAVQRLIGVHAAHAVDATIAAFAIIVGSIVIDFFGREPSSASLQHLAAKRWKPTRCISGPICGRRSRC